MRPAVTTTVRTDSRPSLLPTAIVLRHPGQLVASGYSSSSSVAKLPVSTSAYVETTSQRSRRPVSRPLGNASKRWMKAPKTRLFKAAPTVNNQSLFDSVSAPKNQR